MQVTLSRPCLLGLWLLPATAWAQAAPPPADESALGEFVVTGTVKERVTTLAVLPSLSADLEDVVVRSVVRHDFELSGMFDVIPDRKAPPGSYDFDDPVDIDAWKKVGAEVIVKVAARKSSGGKIEVYGIAYFLSVGKEPVYQKKLLVNPSEVRVTAHRVTDALLGAITGRPGGFASHFTFSSRWARTSRIFVMDADGDGLTPITSEAYTAIAPTWGPGASVYYAVSKNYSPFELFRWSSGQHQKISLSSRESVYSLDFSPDQSKLALAIADRAGSSLWVGNPEGGDLKKLSSTDVATHPVWSPSGKLAWIGGKPDKTGSQRVYVDGKAVSPPGFTAAAPTFCDTEDGIRLVYSVAVGGNRQDLVMSDEQGRGIQRLTQNQGTNVYPACSTDGRLLAFFSTGRNSGPGLYVMSLKRWRTQRVIDRAGESLRWAPLPASAGAKP
jgi:TolB protein